jgi:hypothetical protein
MQLDEFIGMEDILQSQIDELKKSLKKGSIRDVGEAIYSP